MHSTGFLLKDFQLKEFVAAVTCYQILQYCDECSWSL